jgi:hypothetical protein
MTVLPAVKECQILRENFVGQDRDTSLEESETAIVMLPNSKAGYHEELTRELQEWEEVGYTTAPLKMPNIVWEQ